MDTLNESKISLIDLSKWCGEEGYKGELQSTSGRIGGIETLGPDILSSSKEGLLHLSDFNRKWEHGEWSATTGEIGGFGVYPSSFNPIASNRPSKILLDENDEQSQTPCALP